MVVDQKMDFLVAEWEKIDNEIAIKNSEGGIYKLYVKTQISKSK